MIATVYYLNWDQEGRDGMYGPSRELFAEANLGNLPDQFREDQFDQLYREVAEDIAVDDPSAPEQLWQEWNRGSGYESQVFEEAEERSMSVGDVVEVDGTYYIAAPIGWEEIDIDGGDA